MTDSPEMPDVFEGASSDALGAASLMLWTTLTRCLVEKGVLTREDVQSTIRAAHDELSHEASSGPVMALLARVAMNAT